MQGDDVQLPGLEVNVARKDAQPLVAQPPGGELLVVIAGGALAGVTGLAQGGSLLLEEAPL
ncbi:hypothetical protein [Parahaliea maris]|uniref:hypothetical protein n=1 Tax=Parahaliea maris TaxID=2716870 RepID=UPI001F289895|nr:hypothetical protein [Parahaliea maris]